MMDTDFSQHTFFKKNKVDKLSINVFFLNKRVGSEIVVLSYVVLGI